MLELLRYQSCAASLDSVSARGSEGYEYQGGRDLPSYGAKLVSVSYPAAESEKKLTRT